MRAKKKLRFGLAATAVVGAFVAVASGCGGSLPSGPSEPDGGVDAMSDDAPSPAPTDADATDSAALEPDATELDASNPDAAAPDAAPPPTYAIGGNITGLDGTGLVLHSGAEVVDVDAGATSFTFPTEVLAGAEFDVTVEAQPTSPAQQCVVTGGAGTVVDGDVVTIAVNCTTSAFTVGGTVTGLAGSGLVLTRTKDADGGSEDVDLPIGAVGTFAFPAQLSGSTYSVHVKTQPASPQQECVVTNGGGIVEGSDITSVGVTCSTKAYAVGGTVTGYAGSGLVLTNGGVDDEPISADGHFVFDSLVASGASYAVDVKQQPNGPHQRCVIGNGAGTVVDAPVATITVTCKDVAYVDVAHGSDSSTGGPTDPWKTLTHAIAATRAAPVDIFVAPGTYNRNTGEIFPIRPRSHQNIVGDIAHKGAGSTPTLLSGVGDATYAGGDAVGEFPHGVFFGVGVMDASLRGIEVRVPRGENIGFETANVTIEAVTLKGSDDVAFVVAHGSSVTVVDSDFQDGIWNVAVVDAGTRFTMRSTKISKPTESGVVLGYLTAFTGNHVDLGTEASPGNNDIHGGPGGLSLWLNKSSSGSVVTAIGNTWKPNVQGADAAGKYPTSFIDGSAPVPYVGGNNYSISTPGAGSGIRY